MLSDAPLLIRLFGPPEFKVNGEPLPRLKTRKSLYILALLTLRHGRDVDRNWLAGTLWPENDEETALTYLRQALTELRRALGEQAGRILSPSQKTLHFDIGDAADVDYFAFEGYLKRGDTASLEKAVALYRGPLLEGWTEEWLLSQREASALSYLNALEAIARHATESGASDEGVRFLRLLVAADPLRESASRSLMQALANTNDFAAVTQVYRELRATLRREVNAEPDAQTQALFAQLRGDARRQAAGTSASVSKNVASVPTAASPTIERVTGPVVSLPRPLSEFIGRVREVATTRHILTTSRLVTLTGVGGVGKTRLAICVAEECAADYRDGVRFVDLSPLNDPTLVAKKTADTLGITEQPGKALISALCNYLREQHLLLVLDNCEHLTEACAHFATALLQECPNVRILATSRQRLGITGETVRHVPPLNTPDLKLLQEDDKNAAAALIEYESVRLFVDRAQRVQPNLHLNPQTLRSIAILCRRLEGIPLALELAAARMSALTPEQITARLKERFRLLSAGDRTAPTRQRTLRAALDWSFDLLQPEEQVLLRRLSVFVGGWTLEAAETVCAFPIEDGSLSLEVWEVMDCLASLADHSLVVVESENGHARYRLLETVREYGQERLRDDSALEALRLRAGHRDYFLQFVQEAIPHLGSTDQAQWLNRLERDNDNLRAVLDGCLEEGTPDALRIALLLSGELRRFWSIRGHAVEGRQRYSALLSRAPDTLDLAQERSRALLGAGILAKNQADYAAAREALEQCLAIHRQMGNRQEQITPLHVLGEITSILGDYPSAQRLLEEALALSRETGQRTNEAAILNVLGNVRANQGDVLEARSFSEQALVIIQETGDYALEANVLNGLGILAIFQKDYPQALIRYEQALTRNREIGNLSQVILNLYNLADTARRMGDFARVEDYYRQALLLNRELGSSRSKRVVAYLLLGMADTAQRHRLWERAARLLGASDAQRETIGIPLDAEDQAEYEQLTAVLEEALGMEAFTTLLHEGRTIGPDKAIQLALQE